MILILLGPPAPARARRRSCSSAEYRVPHISTGDMFREHKARGTEIGKKVQAIMDAGGLVTDDVTNAMVKERLARPDVAHGFILDGYPRTNPQAEYLDGLLDVAGPRHHARALVRGGGGDARRADQRPAELPEVRRDLPRLAEPAAARRATATATATGLVQRDDDKPENVKKRHAGVRREDGAAEALLPRARAVSQHDGRHRHAGGHPRLRRSKKLSRRRRRAEGDGRVRARADRAPDRGRDRAHPRRVPRRARHPRRARAGGGRRASPPASSTGSPRARTRERGAEPAFLGYHGFPASLCTSVNDEVVHGIPSEGRVLSEGDIVGARLRGRARRLVRRLGAHRAGGPGRARRRPGSSRRRARRSTRGIAAAVPGGRIGDIGAAVQAHVEARGFSVVRDFVGHGIGRRLHEPPQVPNFGDARHRAAAAAGDGARHRADGERRARPRWRSLEDGWTAVTARRQPVGAFRAHDRGDGGRAGDPQR